MRRHSSKEASDEDAYIQSIASSASGSKELPTVRFSMNAAPCMRDVRDDAGLLWGACVRPFLRRGDSGVMGEVEVDEDEEGASAHEARRPLLDSSASTSTPSGVMRCGKCWGYWTIHSVLWSNTSSKEHLSREEPSDEPKWKCGLCGADNLKFPGLEPSADELSSPVVESVVERIEGAKSAYFFLLDVTKESKHELTFYQDAMISAIQALPLGSYVGLGVIEDSSLCLFELGRGERSRPDEVEQSISHVVNVRLSDVWSSLDFRVDVSRLDWSNVMLRKEAASLARFEGTLLCAIREVGRLKDTNTATTNTSCASRCARSVCEALESFLSIGEGGGGARLIVLTHEQREKIRVESIALNMLACSPTRRRVVLDVLASAGESSPRRYEDDEWRTACARTGGKLVRLTRAQLQRGDLLGALEKWATTPLVFDCIVRVRCGSEMRIAGFDQDRSIASRSKDSRFTPRGVDERARDASRPRPWWMPQSLLSAFQRDEDEESHYNLPAQNVVQEGFPALSEVRIGGPFLASSGASLLPTEVAAEQDEDASASASTSLHVSGVSPFDFWLGLEFRFEQVQGLESIAYPRVAGTIQVASVYSKIDVATNTCVRVLRVETRSPKVSLARSAREIWSSCDFNAVIFLLSRVAMTRAARLSKEEIREMLLDWAARCALGSQGEWDRKEEYARAVYGLIRSPELDIQPYNYTRARSACGCELGPNRLALYLRPKLMQLFPHQKKNLALSYRSLQTEGCYLLDSHTEVLILVRHFAGDDDLRRDCLVYAKRVERAMKQSRNASVCSIRLLDLAEDSPLLRELLMDDPSLPHWPAGFETFLNEVRKRTQGYM